MYGDSPQSGHRANVVRAHRFLEERATYRWRTTLIVYWFFWINGKGISLRPHDIDGSHMPYTVTCVQCEIEREIRELEAVLDFQDRHKAEYGERHQLEYELIQ